MPNILVTGGTGFLGKRVVRSLVRQGHQVQLLLREQSDLSGVQAFIPMEHHAQLKACYGFRDDGARLNAALQECISVIHLAVCSSGFRARMLHENMELTRKLAEAIAKTALPRLVHVSSLGVYGELPANSTLDEESPLEQHPERRDSYTHSKLAQEKILKEIEA
nr:NAD-dependent epimerase/dehydratase family protein [Gemmatales bacterium]